MPLTLPLAVEKLPFILALPAEEQGGEGGSSRGAAGVLQLTGMEPYAATVFCCAPLHP